MIDFSKITKTLDGYDCHYFGTRVGFDGAKLHCFGVWTPTGLYEKCYDDQGRHLVWEPNGMKWKVCESNAFAIVRPPKIVEVTRWIALYKSNITRDGYTVSCFQDEPVQQPDMLCKIHQTLRFEVPHE